VTIIDLDEGDEVGAVALCPRETAPPPETMPAPTTN
jgi:hypothetical protein